MKPTGKPGKRTSASASHGMREIAVQAAAFANLMRAKAVMPTAVLELPSEFNASSVRLARELADTARIATQGQELQTPRADAASSSSSSVPVHTTNSGGSSYGSSPQTGSRRLFLAELKRAAGLVAKQLLLDT